MKKYVKIIELDETLSDKGSKAMFDMANQWLARKGVPLTLSPPIEGSLASDDGYWQINAGLYIHEGPEDPNGYNLRDAYDMGTDEEDCAWFNRSAIEAVTYAWNSLAPVVA